MTGVLKRLGSLWRNRVGGARWRALAAFSLLTVIAAAHLARLGTLPYRALAAGILVAVALLMVHRGWRDRRDWRSARRTIGRVLVPTDRELGERALRALTVAERANGPQFEGSRDLAQYHFERLLARASLEAVKSTALRQATRWRWAAAGCACFALVALLPGPMRVAEGLNVFLAVDGRAPLPMKWLRTVTLTAQPPAYLRASNQALRRSKVRSVQAVGTSITVRGVPVRAGRRLVLTDSIQEVPFVNDGAGGVIARWTLLHDTTLHVAARFGDVTVAEDQQLALGARRDKPPTVRLEGAPRTVRLSEIDRLQILYSVSDDHGLRQIDLVLRSGEHEDRRVLMRLSGEEKSKRGGHALTPRDGFLRRMFLPVQISVEARDNDPLKGPKWGKSAPITVMPPAVGEPEARRFAALVAAQQRIVDFLAWQLGQPDPGDWGHQERVRAMRAADELRAALGDSYSGLSVPDGLTNFLLGQMKVLHSRPPAGSSPLRRTEDVLLATSVALEALARRDAQKVAQRLADAAEEAAAGASQARETERRAVGLARLDTAIDALEEGGGQLRRLGALGHDLGSVALSELGRVQRARAREELLHAELAAAHLAARLRRPRPSAALVRGAGTEAGGIGGPSMWGEPSHADDLFNQLAMELSQLTQEHAEAIHSVEQALAEAEQAADLTELREEARRRAEAIRRSIAGLPLPGAEPGSARAAAALGREHAGSMAQSLERLTLSEAVQSGRNALSAMRDAARRSRRSRSAADWVEPSFLRQARRRLKKELEWAQRALDKLRQRAEARARASLTRAGKREHGLAERAGNLSGRGRINETALPHGTVLQLERAGSLMREAAQQLQQGSGDRGLSLQRKAQRLLERSLTGRTTDDDPPQSPANTGRHNAEHDSGRGMRTDAVVPGADRSARADEFRKRVLEGLAREGGGRLAPAVKRYAEGLLQ